MLTFSKISWIKQFFKVKIIIMEGYYDNSLGKNKKKKKTLS